MKLIFAGTPEFAAQALAALIAAGHQLALVLTQPDRPSGRGMALRPSPVKTLALEHGIEVFQPPTLRDAAAQARLQAVGARAEYHYCGDAGHVLGHVFHCNISSEYARCCNREGCDFF